MTDEIIEIHVETNQRRGEERTMKGSIRNSNTLERRKHDNAGPNKMPQQRRMQRTDRSIARMAGELIPTRRETNESEFDFEGRKQPNEFQIERSEPSSNEKDPMEIGVQRAIKGDVLERSVDDEKVWKEIKFKIREHPINESEVEKSKSQMC